MKTDLKAFSNRKKIKYRIIDDLKHHIKLDSLIQDNYTPNGSYFNGCAITCTLNHPSSSIQFPEWLINIIDKFAKNTSSVEFSRDFNLKLIDAIPVGFDRFDAAVHKFMSFIMTRNLESVNGLDMDIGCKLDITNSIKTVKKYLDNPLRTEKMRISANKTAGAAATPVYRKLEYSAAISAYWATYPLYECQRPVARSLGWAARAETNSAEPSEAKSAAYDSYANRLIEIIKELN